MGLRSFVAKVISTALSWAWVAIHFPSAMTAPIAARATAARIAQELKTELGAAVGYKIRFSDRIGPRPYIATSGSETN
jgi:hypothetical protein